MTYPLSTASARRRLQLCPASAVLPKTADSQSYNVTGTSKHDDIQDGLTKGHDETTRYGIQLGPIWRAIGAEPEPYFFEVAYGYDPLTDTAKCFGHHIDRAYPSSHPTACTVDFEGPVRFGAISILELKSGFTWKEPPATNPQIQQQAVSVARARGVSQVHATMARVRDDASVFLDTADFGPVELACIASDMADEIEAAVLAGPRDIRPSAEACQFCPCILDCPAHRKAVNALAEIDSPGTLTTEQAARAMDQIIAVEAMMRRLKPMIESIAMTHPLTLSDGRVYGSGMDETEKVNCRGLGVLYQYLDGEAIHRILGDLAKTKVWDELRKTQEKGQGEKLVRKVKEEMRELGVLETVQVERIKARKP